MSVGVILVLRVLHIDLKLQVQLVVEARIPTQLL